MSTIILGAGIIGTTTAYYLARAGEPVEVIDRCAGPGMETSFANGGLVTPSMSDPWAAPGMPRKILKWLGDDTAPFLLRLRAVPGLTGWGIKFLQNCNADRWRENMEIVLRVSSYSRDALAELTQETGIAYERNEGGTMRIFRDQASLDQALPVAAELASLGVPYSQLSRAQCTTLEPALEPIGSELTGGLHYPEDVSGDAHVFTRELSALCSELGVKFRFNTTVDAINTEAGRVQGIKTSAGVLNADRFVVALGSHSTTMLRPLGVRLPVYPVKGYSLTIPIGGWNAAPRLPVADDQLKLGVTPLGSQLRVAGTAELNGYKLAPDPRRGERLVTAARELYPDLSIPADVDVWTGLRPVTPDGPPILGKCRYDNLFVNCGQGHLGWTMACGSARLVTDLMTGRTPEIATDGMLFDRFA